VTPSLISLVFFGPGKVFAQLFIESLGVDVGHAEGRGVFVYEIIVI